MGLVSPCLAAWAESRGMVTHAAAPIFKAQKNRPEGGCEGVGCKYPNLRKSYDFCYVLATPKAGPWSHFFCH